MPRGNENFGFEEELLQATQQKGNSMKAHHDSLKTEDIRPAPQPRDLTDDLARLFLELASSGTDGAATVGRRNIHDFLTANGPVPFIRSDGYASQFVATGATAGWSASPALPDYIDPTPKATSPEPSTMRGCYHG